MSSWIEAACELLATEPAIVRVAVAGVRGSGPREPGATMLITPHSQWGTIGGGNLEWQAMEQARRMLADCAGPLQHTEVLRLGPDLAQCCGGEVTLSFQRMPASMRGELLARIAASEPEKRSALWIFGAGHVGQAVMRLLEELPLFDVRWIDNRVGLLPADVAAHVEARFAAEPVELIAGAAPGTYFLVLTHDHELDYQICAAILTRGDAAWTGLIGSQSKAARFRSRLRRAGFGDAAIASLHCPVGLTVIRSKLPAAIAVGIAAQLLALVTHEPAVAANAISGCDPDCRRCKDPLPSADTPAPLETHS
jgi:xanthine dehydrogenase accessory factor